MSGRFVRGDGRKANELRPVKITRRFTKHPHGSVLIEVGDTRVLCTAMVEESVPPFLLHQGRGWVTSEYGMLPGSTPTRKRRETGGRVDGRSVEIRRLIGRALRMAVDLSQMGERQIWIDCDVLQADGGTRTAAITGGFVALADALQWMKKRKLVDGSILQTNVAAVSVGIVDGRPMLDLDYAEDVGADVDMNVVMTGKGELIEIQGTAEHAPFSPVDLDKLLRLARRGIRQLVQSQNRALRQA